MAADYVARCVDDPHLGLGCDYHVILDEVHPGDLLTVHVEPKQLLFLLNAQADDIALDIAKGNDVLIPVDSDGGDLVFVVVEVLLVIEHVAHVAEHLDGAVPGG